MEKAIRTPRKEKLAESKAEIIFLPRILEDQNNFIKRLIPYFDIQTLIRNYEIIKSVNPDIIDDKNRNRELTQMRNNLFRVLEIHGQNLADLNYIPHIKNALLDLLNNVSIITDRSSLRETEKEIRRCFASRPNKIVALSDSHLSTLPTVRALPKSQTGIIVFDTHIDIYKYHDIPTKGNVFRYLFDEDQIKAAAFLGFEQSANVETELGIENGIIKVSDKVLNSRIPGIVDQKIKNILSFFEGKGVSNIIFSIDLDVLDLARTGKIWSEFSIFSLIVALGVQDLEIAISQHPRYNKDLVDQDSSLSSWVVEKVYEGLKSLSFLVPNVDQMWNVRIPQVRGKGIRLETIKYAIRRIKEEAKIKGINIGVGLSAGGIYLGDIVEIPELDYQNNTSRLVKKLTQELIKG